MQWHTDYHGLDTDFSWRDGHGDAMQHGNDIGFLIYDWGDVLQKEGT